MVGEENLDLSGRFTGNKYTAELYGSHLGYHEAAFIGDRLRSELYPENVMLRILNVEDNNMDAEATAHICEGLGRNSGVARFTLAGNSIGDAGAEPIAAVLIANGTNGGTLKELICDRCEFTLAGERIVARAFTIQSWQ